MSEHDIYRAVQLAVACFSFYMARKVYREEKMSAQKRRESREKR